MPGCDGETDPVERRGLGAFIFEGHILEADRALEFRPQAVGQRALLGSAVEHPADLRERHARLLHVLQKAREVHERGGDAAAQHHEADQGAERQRVVRGQCHIGAERQHADLGVFLERHHQHHGPVAEPAHLQVELAHLGDPLIPFRGACAFEAERLHRADAVDALDQCRALVGFRLDQLVRHARESARGRPR